MIVVSFAPMCCAPRAAVDSGRECAVPAANI